MYCSVKYWGLDFIAEGKTRKKGRCYQVVTMLLMPCLNAFGFYSVVGSLLIELLPSSIKKFL